MAEPATKQVQGYTVQILGFIPIPKDDLRKQSEIPMLILDVQEGRKTFADLEPHLKAVEFRCNHTGRRVEQSELDAWAKSEPAKKDANDEED